MLEELRRRNYAESTIHAYFFDLHLAPTGVQHEVTSPLFRHARAPARKLCVSSTHDKHFPLPCVISLTHDLVCMITHSIDAAPTTIIKVTNYRSPFHHNSDRPGAASFTSLYLKRLTAAKSSLWTISTGASDTALKTSGPRRGESSWP
jgi:hypothetical protein